MFGLKLYDISLASNRFFSALHKYILYLCKSKTKKENIHFHIRFIPKDATGVLTENNNEKVCGMILFGSNGPRKCSIEYCKMDYAKYHHVSETHFSKFSCFRYFYCYMKEKLHTNDNNDFSQLNILGKTGLEWSWSIEKFFTRSFSS